jgi:Ca2+-binding EF-hand superfamily protein
MQEFTDFGMTLFHRFENSFSHIGYGVDYHFFCESIEKVLNYSNENFKKIFFLLIDLNKDGKICEADLFGVF